MATKAERIIKQLFEAYMAAQEILPAHVQSFIEERGLERTVCDHIAGMTDRYAVAEYEKLFNPMVKP